MKKYDVITMLQNEKLYNSLKNKFEEYQINIFEKDIQYYEAIKLILEQYNEIKYLIINMNVVENKKYEVEIKKIKNEYPDLKIIEVNINIKENKIQIIEKNIKNIVNELSLIEKNIEKNKNINISFVGEKKEGKTIISFIIALLLSKKKKKIKYIQEGKNIDINIVLGFDRTKYKSNIIKYNNYLDIYLKDVENTKEYDYIIWDHECKKDKSKINKKMMKVYILQGNYLSVYNLNKYILANEDKDSKKNKNYFILNFYNKESMHKEIIENIFNIKCLGEIEYISIMDSLINKKFNLNIFELNNIKNIFEDVIKKIERNYKSEYIK